MINVIPPFDPETLSTEQGKEWTAISALRQRNAARIARIESMSASIDTTSARLDHLLTSLHQLGILSTDDFLKILKDWELVLRSQTKPLLERVEAQYADAMRRQRAAQIAATGQTPSGLIVPPSAAGG